MAEQTTKKTLIGAGVLFGAALLVFGNKSNVPQQREAPKQKEFLTSAQAWATCQNAMLAAAKFPDKAEVPFVDDQAGLSEGYFAWGPETKHMMMMNGLGLLAPTTGSCNVDKVTGKITGLTINGKTII